MPGFLWRTAGCLALFLTSIAMWSGERTGLSASHCWCWELPTWC
ncbi:hypothetical protein EVA_20432 [gut metagenome]|uniref:Uncharacterized protein n=1 Tax=gut metagenome TaxID=749906 RepID=J9F973_9ZZZZ